MRTSRITRRLLSRLCRRLYRDHHPDPARSVLIAGTARSGTTWLADLLVSQASCRMMFEPFHCRKIPELSGLNYFQYLRPEQPHAVLESFSRRLFSGRIRDPWIDREVRRLRPRCRVIKEIRANLFLRWLHDRFPAVKMLLLLRHPCAVVASRVRLGWDTDADLDPLLAQPDLLEVLPAALLERIRREGSDVEKHAAIWAVSNRIPLIQFRRDELPVVFYEELVAEPERAVPPVFAAAGLPHDRTVFARLGVPSTTARGGVPGLAAWKRRLSNVQIRQVLRVAGSFGLGQLYDESERPLTRDPWARDG